MNFFDEQARTALNFLELLDQPRIFQQRRHDDFFNNMNKSRETFVENQRVPERLSATRLGNLQNRYGFDELSQNYGVNLQTSGIAAGNALADAQFTRDNRGLAQSVTVSNQNRTINDNRTAIEQAAADERFSQLTEELPFVQEANAADYYRDLIDASASDPNSRDVRQRIIEDFQDRFFNAEAQKFENVTNQINELEDIIQFMQSGPTLTDTQRANMQSRFIELQNAIQRGTSNLNREVLTLGVDYGLLNAQQFERISAYARESGIASFQQTVPETTPTITPTGVNTPGVPAQTVVQSDGQPVVPQEQPVLPVDPSNPQPLSNNIVSSQATIPNTITSTLPTGTSTIDQTIPNSVPVIQPTTTVTETIVDDPETPNTVVTETVGSPTVTSDSPALDVLRSSNFEGYTLLTQPLSVSNFRDYREFENTVISQNIDLLNDSTFREAVEDRRAEEAQIMTNVQQMQTDNNQSITDQTQEMSVRYSSDPSLIFKDILSLESQQDFVNAITQPVFEGRIEQLSELTTEELASALEILTLALDDPRFNDVIRDDDTIRQYVSSRGLALSREIRDRNG